MLTESELAVVRALVALAWADGVADAPEHGVLEGMLVAFGAPEQQEAEILAWAARPRQLTDVAWDQVLAQDRELLLQNGALLTHADGSQTDAERRAFAELCRQLAATEEEICAAMAAAHGV